MIPETDQWKLNGNCDKCRRNEYCKKPCTANKRAYERRLRGTVEGFIDSHFSDSFAYHLKKFL